MTDYAYRSLQLRDQIAKVLADREGKAWAVEKLRFPYQSHADDLITAWRRNPRESATDIDRLCQAVIDNDRALEAHRQKLAEERAKLNPGPDLKEPPKAASFTIHDPSGGVILVSCHDDGRMTWAWAS